jgi:hypothetical protein
VPLVQAPQKKKSHAEQIKPRADEQGNMKVTENIRAIHNK